MRENVSLSRMGYDLSLCLWTSLNDGANPSMGARRSMLLVSLISYIDRNTLALLAPTILKETGLTGQQYGFIISAFSIAYMLANPAWGGFWTAPGCAGDDRGGGLLDGRLGGARLRRRALDFRGRPGRARLRRRRHLSRRPAHRGADAAATSSAGAASPWPTAADRWARW